MAKKQEPSKPRRTLNQTKSKTQNVSKKSTKNKFKAAKDDSSSTESQNDGVLESSEEDNGVEVKEKAKSSTKKGKKEGLRKLGKKKNRKREEEDEAEEMTESVLYRFPMKRISRIIRSEISDIRISQEAVFLINRASEKFLELFSKEAYACALVDRKKHIAYDHMSAVVSKRRRFNFLRDFVPEKVKAEYALAQIPEADK